MKDPFADGGLLDRTMPYVAITIAVCFLVKGVSRYRNGGSAWWIVAAGALMLLASQRAYGLVREARRKHPECERP